MPKPKWVRVRDTSGHHISVRGDVPEDHPRGVQAGQRKLKQDAVDFSGDPLPPTYRTELGDGPAPSTKVKAKPRKAASQDPVPPAADEPSEAASGQQADIERQD
jgi:hypothetical protein